MSDEQKITYFAETDHRGRKKAFGIKEEDRMKHVYVIGKTGMGKSTLLENMAAQDIKNGNGIAFIDPHGSAVETLLDYVPEERINDVIYFAPFDTDYPISFNIMEDVGYDKRHLVVSGLMSAFRKIWKDTWSARMEYILQNTLLALLEYPDATILGVNRMLIDKEYRKKVIEKVTDPVVKSFWVDEFAKYTDRYTQEATPAIQNKIGQFVSNPLIRNIVGQPKSSFDFRRAMDEKKILLMNLSKGRTGDTNAQLIGSMLIIKIYLAAMSRAEISRQDLKAVPPFYFFVDEFQAFANETFADILSESRKYKLSLTIAHQYIEQMPEEVRDAVFGNIGTTIIFRVGAYDAEVLEKEFMPTFTAEDIVNLGFIQIYLKLMIDGIASRPFSARTLPPLSLEKKSFKEAIIDHSRETYAYPRAKVEAAIQEWHAPIISEKKEGEDKRFPQPQRRAGDAFLEARPRSREPMRENSFQQREPRREEYFRRDGVPRERREERREERPQRKEEREQRVFSPVNHEKVSVPEPKPHVSNESPTPLAGNHSFKSAFENERMVTKERVEEKKETISLAALETIQRAKKEGGGGVENKNALKQALAEALKNRQPTTNNQQPTKDNSEQSTVSSQRSAVNGQRTTISSQQTTNNKQQIMDNGQQQTKKRKEIPEIPENELREMLRVEKEKEGQ